MERRKVTMTIRVGPMPDLLRAPLARRPDRVGHDRAPLAKRFIVADR